MNKIDSNGPYGDAEAILAEVLYELYQDGADCSKGDLGDQKRWLRVARFVMHREVTLIAKMRQEFLSKFYAKKAVDQMQEWFEFSAGGKNGAT